MLRITSGWTLVLRIFLPVFYLVFMSAWTIATIYSGDEVSPVFANWIYRIGMIIIILITLFLIKITIWKLRRIDVSDDFIYTTNYFRTFRYPLSSIDRIETWQIGWMRFITIHLKEKGSLGDKITGLIESKVWNDFLLNHVSFQQLIKSFG